MLNSKCYCLIEVYLIDGSYLKIQTFLTDRFRSIRVVKSLLLLLICNLKCRFNTCLVLWIESVSLLTFNTQSVSLDSNNKKLSTEMNQNLLILVNIFFFSLWSCLRNSYEQSYLIIVSVVLVWFKILYVLTAASIRFLVNLEIPTTHWRSLKKSMKTCYIIFIA